MFGSGVYSTANLTINEFRFVAGLNIIYEFGHQLEAGLFKPVIYVNYERNYLSFYFGAFPNEFMATFPTVLRSDTFQYYHPTCEGALLEFRQNWGSQSVWIDWLSRQTNSDREIFQIGGTGMLEKGVFFYRHDFIMTHNAYAAIRPDNSYIRDNGGIVASIGADLSNYLFDSITISTGYTMSYDRMRGITDLTFRHGSVSQLYIEVFSFAIRESLYLGDGQFQLWGDRLFRAGYYNRMDLIWHFFRRCNIKGSVEFSLHLVENELDLSQSVKITADLISTKPVKLPD